MFFALLYSAHPVFSNELNNKISKYLQRKHFDIDLIWSISIIYKKKREKNIPVASSLVTPQFIF